MRPLGLRSISPHRLLGFVLDVIGSSPPLGVVPVISPVPFLRLGEGVAIPSRWARVSWLRSGSGDPCPLSPSRILGCAQAVLPGLLFGLLCITFAPSLSHSIFSVIPLLPLASCCALHVSIHNWWSTVIVNPVHDRL
jgi:hypothetical protein